MKGFSRNPQGLVSRIASPPKISGGGTHTLHNQSKCAVEETLTLRVGGWEGSSIVSLGLPSGTNKHSKGIRGEEKRQPHFSLLGRINGSRILPKGLFAGAMFGTIMLLQQPHDKICSSTRPVRLVASRNAKETQRVQWQ